MNNEIKSFLEKTLNAKNISFEKVSGCDISEKFKVNLNGKVYFLKVNSLIQSFDMFEKEALGLRLLDTLGGMNTPTVLKVGKSERVSFILMDYIISKKPSQADMKYLGRQLRLLHERNFEHYGFDNDSYIGNLIQKNVIAENWTTFFIKRRIKPQLDLAYSNGLMHKEESINLKYMEERLSLLLSNVKPSLLHGDFWSGNYLIAENGTPYLIDPAVYYGHSEVDIAMSLLFGGFGKTFYDGYYENKRIDAKYSERVEIYQLYYLLVHLNMFGKSYLPSVMNILKKHFK